MDQQPESLSGARMSFELQSSPARQENQPMIIGGSMEWIYYRKRSLSIVDETFMCVIS